MSDKVLKLRIQQKYDTVANWRNSTLPLLLGELALDETNGIKIGDGENVWNNLPYVTDALAAQLSASILTLDNKIDGVDNNFQSAVVSLNTKIDSLETSVSNINTNIEIIENNEVPTSKLVDPVDDVNVIINCGDSTN